MGMLKQVQSLKIHPSGWPFLAFLCLSGFLIGSFWEAPILVTVGSVAVGIYLFRIQTPTIPNNQGIITAPVRGKVSDVEQIHSPDTLLIPPRQYLKIGIRCGLFYPASLHAPTSIKILDKQKADDGSSRKIIITATTTDLAQNNVSEELILVFSSVIPRWFSECDDPWHRRGEGKAKHHALAGRSELHKIGIRINLMMSARSLLHSVLRPTTTTTDGKHRRLRGWLVASNIAMNLQQWLKLSSTLKSFGIVVP